MADAPKVVQVTLVWDGDEYVLQHPGNQAWLEKYQDMFVGKTDLSGFAKWCFDEVVHPVKGEKLTLDSVSPARLMDWVAVLQTFFASGELHPDFEWKNYKGTGYFIGEKESRKKRSLVPQEGK